MSIKEKCLKKPKDLKSLKSPNFVGLNSNENKLSLPLNANNTEIFYKTHDDFSVSTLRKYFKSPKQYLKNSLIRNDIEYIKTAHQNFVNNFYSSNITTYTSRNNVVSLKQAY